MVKSHKDIPNHYYGFVNLPNQWISDNDRSYPDRFFDDKNYEDFYFDNFYDMDEMFGHENSLFGTKGLPVGHPDRSSKSFDVYTKKHGPMIVRVIKKNDLQEQIRRVLREELSTRIRRRLSYNEMENEFIESFEEAYRLTKKRKVLSSHFLDELVYTTITFMMDGVHWRFVSTLPEDEFWYDDIHKELENHYRDRIIQMYNESKGIKESIPTSNIVRILKEQTNMNNRLKRRLGMLDYEIESKMRAVYRPDNICQYKNGDELVEVVMEAAIDSMYWNYFADTDDNSGDWVNMYYDMVKYIREKYGDKIKEYYHINCGN